MRIATRVWVAAMAIAAVASSASAAELSGAPTPGPAKEEGSAQAQIWFERALSLDIGAAGRLTRSRPLPQCGTQRNLVTRRRRSMLRSCSIAAAA